MKEWKIPMTWQVYGICKVEAETLEEAKKIAMAWDTDFPCGVYVNHTARLDNDKKIQELNKESLILQDE